MSSNLKALHDAIAQTAVDHQCARVALLVLDARKRRERLPRVRLGGKLEAFRHDADHQRGAIVDANRAADERGIAVKSILPDAEREDHHRGRARLIVIGLEVAAEKGCTADQAE